MSVFKSNTELACHVRSESGNIQTEKLLDVCRQVLPVVEKLGTGFGLVKMDVGGNIDRLAARAATNPAKYDSDLFQIVRDEVAEGTHTGSSSCTKGLLWLKRAMEFIIGLLVRLHSDRSVSMSEAASETYRSTLQHYHGWVVTSTFTVVLNLVPSRQNFIHKVAAPGMAEEQVFAEMAAFCEAFEAVLQQIQHFLSENGLDDPTKV